MIDCKFDEQAICILFDSQYCHGVCPYNCLHSSVFDLDERPVEFLKNINFKELENEFEKINKKSI